MEKQIRSQGKEEAVKDVFEILKNDHKLVKNLFQEIMKEKEKNEEIFAQLKSELEVHMEAEEKHLYPRLENEEKIRELILEAYEEHALGKELMGKLEGDPLDEEHWLTVIKVTSDVIDHHIEEEEKLMFPKAKQIIGREEQQSIAEAVMRQKQVTSGAGEEGMGKISKEEIEEETEEDTEEGESI